MLLVIPKGSYIDLDDFMQNAKEKEIIELFKEYLMLQSY